MFFMLNRAKNQMNKQRQGDGGQTDDGAHDAPESSQASQQPATYGTDSRYSIGNMMARVGAAQSGQPINPSQAPAFDRSSVVQRVMSGDATEGPASSNMDDGGQNDYLRAILARISQRNAGY